MNILIVEDSQVLITLYTDIIKTLTNNKFVNIISITDCNLYEFYKDYKFDLALIAWKLQCCNTLSIIKHIVNKTNLYVISGFDNIEEVRNAVTEYGAPIKIKPITVEDINEMLKRIVK